MCKWKSLKGRKCRKGNDRATAVTAFVGLAGLVEFLSLGCQSPFGTVTGQTRSAAVPTAELLSPAAAARDPSRQALGVCGARAAAGWSCGAGTQTYLDAISQIPFMSFLIWGALFDFSAIKWG